MKSLEEFPRGWSWRKFERHQAKSCPKTFLLVEHALTGIPG